MTTLSDKEIIQVLQSKVRGLSSLVGHMSNQEEEYKQDLFNYRRTLELLRDSFLQAYLKNGMALDAAMCKRLADDLDSILIELH